MSLLKTSGLQEKHPVLLTQVAHLYDNLWSAAKVTPEGAAILSVRVTMDNTVIGGSIDEVWRINRLVPSGDAPTVMGVPANTGWVISSNPADAYGDMNLTVFDPPIGDGDDVGTNYPYNAANLLSCAWPLRTV